MIFANLLPPAMGGSSFAFCAGLPCIQKNIMYTHLHIAYDCSEICQTIARPNDIHRHTTHTAKPKFEMPNRIDLFTP